ncbi:MAG: magnesium transporter [Oceanotoga sp.]|jgi:magnesium transporter|uniref:Magnesium transporter MgtE n=1 Tax=Oceanotoga teriensis TaxID=515440 RepID=A0AA45C6Z4_9BACT|nr:MULTISPECIES: magnesium transporter [Oceanotoga]MDN5342624.1 magnesium transporter [Oceanotoga sp.]PWJ95068.1 Mg2+ transporter MgtE [Oceanotoga teriensis]
MFKTDDIVKIMNFISEKNFSDLKAILKDMNIVHISDLIEELPTVEALIVFRLLSKDIAVDVFYYLDKDYQQKIIEKITDEETQYLLKESHFDDMVDLIEEMPAAVVKKVIKNTDENRRNMINKFLNYPDFSAGSIMTLEYVSLKEGMTVEHSIEHIKKVAKDVETIYTAYVLNSYRKLVGIISLRNLLIADEKEFVKNIMTETDIISCKTLDDQEDIARKFRKYDLNTIPVVDNEGLMTGVITVDDIIDVIEEENTEDFEKMAAIEPLNDDYLNTKTFTLARKRITWLIILMVSASLTELVIGRSKEVLESVAILASFIPMLMDTGGNSGSQASTLIIRGLALDEIKFQDIFKVIFKEFKVSLIVASALSFLNFLRIYFISGVDIRIAFLVGITLFLTVVISKIIGAILPMFAQKLKLDPAIMAAPLITTIVDTTALLVYFGFAKLILNI